MRILAVMFKLRYLTFILFLSAFFVLGQVHNFQHLNNQNGLPQSQAYTVCFDTLQNSWIGTQGGGIAIYDGEEISYLTKQDSLVSNRIFKIKRLDNKLYIGCKGGISVADENKEIIKNYYFDTSTVIVQDIVLFKNRIRVATNNGLYHLENNKLVRDSHFKSENIQSLFIEDHDKLWLCTTSGIIQFDNPINKINRARGLRNDFVTKISPFNKGWLIATYGGGLWFYNKANKVFIPEAFKAISSTIVLDVLNTNDELWIATMNNGIYIFNRQDQTLENITVENGLANNNVRCIVKDAWGNKWIGTSGGGVSIFNNSSFLAYNKSNGLNSNYIFAVLNDSRKNLWVATQGLGVMRINDTSRILFDEEYGFESVKTKVIFEDSRQNIWLGTEGRGVGVILASSEKGAKKDTVLHYYANSGLANNWVKSFTEDQRRNRIYIGTANGIYRASVSFKEGGGVVFRKLKLENSPKRVNRLVWNKASQRLYFAADEGAGYIKDKTVHYFDHQYQYRSIADFDSIVWFGSVDQGVLKVMNTSDSFTGSWLNVSNGLESNMVYQLTADFPFLWIGTEKGLSRYNFQTKEYTEFGYEEGFEGVETNINASHKDRFGNLWFGTTNGLFLYNTANSEAKGRQKPPYFRIEDIQIFYQSITETKYGNAYKNDSNIVLPHSSNHIGFKMKAIHYTYQNKVKFRWKLVGAENDWGPALENDLATYSNLLPGDYAFLVKASIDDSWDLSPIRFEFTIEAPYWERTWFKASYYSAGALIIGLIIFLIFRRNKRRNQRIIDEIEIEKSMLELEQKALRLQMNPHFIFNVLNSIHNLIILNDSGKARYALAKFSKLMRQVLENSREKLISIDDELETIQNYVQLEKLTADSDFDLELEVDDNIDTNEALLPPLMIQPFIENAIIHGFKSLDRKGMINLKFYLEGETRLVCEIIDNGNGRENAKASTLQKENYHKSTALQVIQERLANLNRKHEDSGFKIIDLKGDKGQPMGTKIRIKIEI